MNKVVAFNDIAALAGCTLGVLLPILTAGDCKVYPVPTAAFTSSTRVKGFRCQPMDDYLDMVEAHWSGLDFDVDAVLTGCAGSARGVRTIARILPALKARGALAIVDPVMGDDGSLFVSDEQVEALRELVKQADVVCPNLTEFCALLGLDYTRAHLMDYAEQLALLDERVASLGVESGVVTGIRHGDEVTNYVWQAGERSLVTHPYYHESVCGTGDMFAGVMTVNLLRGKSLLEAVRFATDWIVDIVKHPVRDPQFGLPIGSEQLAKLAE